MEVGGKLTIVMMHENVGDGVDKEVFGEDIEVVVFFLAVLKLGGAIDEGNLAWVAIQIRAHQPGQQTPT